MLDRSDDTELYIVIPCLNEAATVGVCVAKAVAAMDRLGIAGEVIVADNGSIDGSPDVASRAGATIVYEPHLGYGSAIIAGCAAARGRYILMGDADDSYDFSDIEVFVVALRGGADLVMGTRLKGRILPGAMPWKNRYLGNPLLTRVLRWLFHAPISDAHCGMRAFSKDAFSRMGLRTRGMEFASEMLIRAAKRNLRIEEVPIVFHPDGRGRRPHLRPWRDGWRHVKLMLMFSPTALFLLPGLGLLGAGTLLMVSQLFAPADAPLRIGGLMLDFHWAILGSVLALVGYQVVMVHYFARIYSVTHRIREPDRFLERAVRVLTLGRVLMLAILVTVLGLALVGLVVVRWLISDLGVLLAVHTRLFVLGATLIALGVQTTFNAFFFSILGDHYRFGPEAPDFADEAVREAAVPGPIRAVR